MIKPGAYRICICGGRDYNDHATVFEVLGRMLQNYPKNEIVIINGDSRGADKLAQIWAEDNDIKLETYPANWEEEGKAAGPIRNQLMLSTGIDILIAFPGGKGTAHMMKICREANVYVYDVASEWLPSQSNTESVQRDFHFIEEIDFPPTLLPAGSQGPSGNPGIPGTRDSGIIGSGGNGGPGGATISQEKLKQIMDEIITEEMTKSIEYASKGWTYKK